MSRRHHGGRPHRTNGHAPAIDGQRPSASPAVPAENAPASTSDIADVSDAPARTRSDVAPAHEAIASATTHPGPPEDAGPRPEGAPATNGNGNGAPRPWAPGGAEAASAAGCTAPQLRRFIKSRPYVPMHELRRRFGINGGEDDVTPVDLGVGRVFVGLPAREGALLGELLRGGEIGYELSLDPRSPVVVGLYPMRPVARS